METTEQTSKPSPQTKWKSKNRLAVWAQTALRSALRRGLIERQPCEVCGEPRTDGHHDDYHRPMKVRWLCRLHHRAAHAKAKADG